MLLYFPLIHQMWVWPSASHFFHSFMFYDAHLFRSIPVLPHVSAASVRLEAKNCISLSIRQHFFQNRPENPGFNWSPSLMWHLCTNLRALYRVGGSGQLGMWRRGLHCSAWGGRIWSNTGYCFSWFCSCPWRMRAGSSLRLSAFEDLPAVVSSSFP